MTALAGCGRLGFAEHAPGAPAPDAPPCELGPWSDIRPILELAANGTTYGGQISPDGLTLYFDSDRAGDEEIYVAQRPDRASPFGPAQHLAVLGSPDIDEDATVTGDELELMFVRISASGVQMLRTTRASSEAPWDPPQPVAVAGAGPALSFDGLTLFYNSGIDGRGEGEIYVTARATRTDPFAPGTLVAPLAGMPYRGFASLSPDGLVLLFEAETGPNGALEIWQTTRTAPADAFGPPARIDELAAGGDGSDPSIPADGLELFFASTRGTGRPALYVASRACR